MSSRATIAWFVAFATLAATVPAIGQETELRVSIEEAVRLFSENGLEMRISRARFERESGEARQARAYANPTVSLIHENLDNEGLDYDETILALSQAIEWPGRTSARSRAAKGRVEAASAEFQSDSIRLVFDVRRAFLNAWALEERTKSLAMADTVVRDAVRASEIRLRDGDVSDYETRRLKLEQVRLEQSLAVSELSRSAARRGLATLLVPEGPFESAIASDPPGEFPPDVRPLDPMLALARRPDVAAAELRGVAAGDAARAAGMSWIPPLTLTVGYKDQSDGFTGAVLGASLPIPLFDRRGGEAQAAEARRLAAEAETALLRRQATNDLHLTRERYESALARLQRLGDGVLSEAAAVLETASLAYQEGAFTLLELIDAAEAFREARIGLIDLRAEAWVAYYDLERAMGWPVGPTAEGRRGQDETE